MLLLISLFYDPMVDESISNSDYIWLVDLWNVHNIAYILFSLFIAKAFYVPARS